MDLSSREIQLSIFKREAVDVEKRRVSFVALSADNDIDFGSYKMHIETGGVDLSKLTVFLKDHNTGSVDSVLGKIKNPRLENEDIKCDVIFGTDATSNEIFQKYVDGVLNSCSIGLKVLERDETKLDDGRTKIIVRKASAHELSAVWKGADSGAVVSLNFQKRSEKMLGGNKNEQNIDSKKEIGFKNSVELKDEKLKEEELQLEQKQKELKRQNDILDIALEYGVAPKDAEIFKNDTSKTKDDFYKFILDGKVKETATSTVKVVGGDIPNKDGAFSAITDAVCIRAGLNLSTPHKDYGQFMAHKLGDVANFMFGSKGTIDETIKFALSTDDFPYLLGNIANKVSGHSFKEANSTFETWTKSVELSDFKERTEVGVSSFGDLKKISEGGELEHDKPEESFETWKIDSYGKKFRLSRQAIINDDLGFFTGIIQKLAATAKRKANALAYEVLTGSYKMSDGTDLFSSSTHANLASPGTIIDASSLGKARTAMRKQKDKKGNILNIAPRYLLVSPDKEYEALTLLSSPQITLIDASGKQEIVKNIYSGSLVPIVDANIVDANIVGNNWYLAAQTGTVQVGYLRGSGKRPIIEQREKSLIHGLEYEMVFDFGVMAEDYRGLYKNPGA